MRNALAPASRNCWNVVEEHRSLRAAAQSMGMAYSKAWTVVRRCETAPGVPAAALRHRRLRRRRRDADPRGPGPAGPLPDLTAPGWIRRPARFFPKPLTALRRTPMDYKLIRSDRRTLALEITREGQVLVRAPHQATQDQIDDFLSARQDWLSSRLQRVRDQSGRPPHPRRGADPGAPRQGAGGPPRAGPLLRRPDGPTARQPHHHRRQTRFGSCSSRGRISFSWLLMQYPQEAIDYVVVHELAHLVHQNPRPGLLPAGGLGAAGLPPAGSAAAVLTWAGRLSGPLPRRQPLRRLHHRSRPPHRRPQRRYRRQIHPSPPPRDLGLRQPCEGRSDALRQEAALKKLPKVRKEALAAG